MVLTLCPRLPRQPNNSLNQTRPLLGHRATIIQSAFVACSQVGAWARRLDTVVGVKGFFEAFSQTS